MPETMSRFSGLQSEILKLLDNASNLIALLEDEYSYKISYPFGDVCIQLARCLTKIILGYI